MLVIAGTVAPWAYAAINRSSICPVSGVLRYTFQPVEHASCRLVSLWNLLCVPLALVCVSLWKCSLENVFTFHGRRAMLYVYRMLDLMMPSLDVLKYHQTPYFYTYISQGFAVMLLQMIIQAVLLRDISAVVLGYTANKFLLYVAPVALAPSPATIGMLQSELLSWTDEPMAQSFFLRLLTHKDAFLAMTSIEFHALCEAGKEGGKLEQLFEDAKNQELSIWKAGELVKRHVHLRPLYISTIHVPNAPYEPLGRSCMHRISTLEFPRHHANER